MSRKNSDWDHEIVIDTPEKMDWLFNHIAQKFEETDRRYGLKEIRGEDEPRKTRHPGSKRKKKKRK